MKQSFTASVWQEGEWYIAQCIQADVASQGATAKMRLSIICATLLNCTSRRQSPQSYRTFVISETSKPHEAATVPRSQTRIASALRQEGDWSLDIFPEGDPSSSPGLLYSATLGKTAASSPTPPGLWPSLPAYPIGSVCLESLSEFMALST